MKAYIVIPVVLVASTAAYFGWKKYSNRDTKQVSGSTPSDGPCGYNGKTQIVGSCTPPLFYPLPSGVKEKCFTSAQLGLNEGDTGWAIVTDNNGFGTKWYFNYQNGDKFCYASKDPKTL